MTTPTPSIQFFEGVYEELSDVSLRRNRNTGVRTALFSFAELKSLERFRSYTKQFKNAIHLMDEEGEITIEPSSVQFFYGGDEGDDLKRVDCKLEIDQEDHWERFMRFMHRYAEAHGMAYGEREAGQSSPDDA